MTEKLVTIANFAFGPDPASEAELARIKLEAEGISCFLIGKNFPATYWLLSVAERGIKLQVKQSDAKKALEVLGTHKKVDVEETEQNKSDSRPSSPKCPKCNSDDIEYEKFSKKVFYLSILFLRFPLPFLKKGYRCNNCGYTWK
jgi:hypothetical protein